jgi:hypothetical protein
MEDSPLVAGRVMPIWRLFVRRRGRQRLVSGPIPEREFKIDGHASKLAPESSRHKEKPA